MQDQLSPAELRLWTLFGEIGALDQLGRAVAERSLVGGLSLAQFGVLGHLARGDASPLGLARAFGVTKQTMTSTLARLRAQGFIAIRPDPADGRAKLVSLTAEGASAHSISAARLGPALAVAGDRMPAGLVNLLLPRLAELRAAIETAGS